MIKFHFELALSGSQRGIRKALQIRRLKAWSNINCPTDSPFKNSSRPIHNENLSTPKFSPFRNPVLAGASDQIVLFALDNLEAEIN
jgi:hypothetical protein